MTKIAVIGDSMVDEDYHVVANRISPEFPIPVMLSETESPTHQYPGGAANVALQLISQKARTTLVTLLDPDARNIFDQYGITKKELCCYCDKKFRIPRKRRLYKGDFPLCRWDIEKQFTDEKAIADLVEILERQITPDVVVLSNYNKGFFNNKKSKQQWIKNKRWITVVDPKVGPLADWEGCTICKPNFEEATNLTGTSNPELQAKIIMEITKCKLVAITDGGTFYGFDGNEFWQQEHSHQPARYPIGAGDCFIAALALAYTSHTPKEATCIAYNHAKAYVNTPKRYITQEDVLKIKTRSMKEVAKDVKNNPQLRFVFTNGCFDILHDQHIDLLKYAKSKGDQLVVALNSDASVKRLKGNSRPINSLEQRSKVLEAIDCIDYLISFDEDTPIDLIRQIKPWAIVKGGDYTKEDVVGYDEVQKNVFIFPYKDGTSTTDIIKRAISN